MTPSQAFQDLKTILATLDRLIPGFRTEEDRAVLREARLQIDGVHAALAPGHRQRRPRGVRLPAGRRRPLLGEQFAIDLLTLVLCITYPDNSNMVLCRHMAMTQNG